MLIFCVMSILSYVLYDLRRLLFLTIDSENSCSKIEKESTFPFSFVVNNLPLWKKMLTKQNFRKFRVTTHFVGTFMLIKNQVRTQGQKLIFS